LSRRPCKAVNAATGAEATCSNVNVFGFHDQHRFQTECRSGKRILGNGPAACAEYLVAPLELVYVPANRFHLASHVNAGSFYLWFAEPGASER
jgi:hypothetical protein